MAFDLELDPAADNYAVVGNPVAHSKGPLIHEAFAAQTGQNLAYRRILVPTGRFPDMLDAFQQKGGKGFNVTLPFKGEAFAAMQVRTPRAEATGAVNTVWFDDSGVRHGDTTDGLGLMRDLAHNGMAVSGARVLILGAGGAVRGLLGELLAAHPAGVTLVNRSLERAEDLRRKFAGGQVSIEVSSYPSISGRFDLIINGTSSGLQGLPPPLPDDYRLQGADCYDMVYGDGPTPFMRWAAARGAGRNLDGIGMLVEQAAVSFEIWRGVKPETQPVIEMLRKLQKDV